MTTEIWSWVDSALPLNARASITTVCMFANPERSNCALHASTGPPTADHNPFPARTCTASAWLDVPRTTMRFVVTLEPLEGDEIATIGGGPAVTATPEEHVADRPE